MIDNSCSVCTWRHLVPPVASWDRDNGHFLSHFVLGLDGRPHLARRRAPVAPSSRRCPSLARQVAAPLDDRPTRDGPPDRRQIETIGRPIGWPANEWAARQCGRATGFALGHGGNYMHTCCLRGLPGWTGSRPQRVGLVGSRLSVFGGSVGSVLAVWRRTGGCWQAS